MTSLAERPTSTIAPPAPVECRPEDVRMGMPAEAASGGVTADVASSKFRPARRGTALPTLLDLHVHSEASEDSRAPVEAYLNWIKLGAGVPALDGIVLTEHRQWNTRADYRALEDRHGIMVLKGAEIETDYGHMLVFGVNDDLARRLDFADVHLPAQRLIGEVARMGGVVVPCHPGRPNVGLCAHYEHKPPLDNVIAVETLNGGSRKGEDERSVELAARFGYQATGGSDSHQVSLIGRCATRFEARVGSIEELVRELVNGRYQPVDFRAERKAARRAAATHGGRNRG
jgi:predicted metal-dependent phosphoesterase TrpH